MLRALLRQLRRRNRHGRRGPATRPAARSQVQLRARGTGGRHRAAHPADPAELAAQPDRQGLQPGRVGARGRTGHPPRPAGGHRRGLRAHCLRGRTHPPRHPAGHARAHRHHQLGRQDVLHHRLEDRLGVRHARVGDRGADLEAVPHLRQRRTLPVRHRRGPQPRRRLLPIAGRRPAGAPRPPQRRAGRRRIRRVELRRHLLRDDPPGAHGRDRRCGVLLVPAGALRRRGGAERGVLRQQGRGATAGAVRLLQAARGDRRGRRAAGHAAGERGSEDRR